MTCQQIGNVIVCGPPAGIHRRTVAKCWTCERRTPFIERFDGAWYGYTRWCLNCLDMFMDGERMRRPFERHWKRDRAAMLRKKWDTAMMPAAFEEYVSDQMHYATCPLEMGCPKCLSYFRQPEGGES